MQSKQYQPLLVKFIPICKIDIEDAPEIKPRKSNHTIQPTKASAPSTRPFPIIPLAPWPPSPTLRKPRPNNHPPQILLRPPPPHQKLKIKPRIRSHILIEPTENNCPHAPGEIARARAVAHAEQKPAFLHHVAPGGHLGGHAVAEAIVDAVEEDFSDEGFVAVGDEAQGAEFDA